MSEQGMSGPVDFPAEGEWAAELAELAARRARGAAMGGPEALAKFRASGRMNARERIAALLDAGSFRELGRTAGKGHYDAQGGFTRLDPTNAIVGTGRVAQRKLALHVDDFSIRAGSSEATIADKWIYIERLAHQLRMPLQISGTNPYHPFGIWIRLCNFL